VKQSREAHTSVTIPVGADRIEGDLGIPEPVFGLVVFAHGSGSSRRSPRNQFVAARLREAGLGTLLLDLLTRDEEKEDLVSARHRFDIPLLAGRLGTAAEWVKRQPRLSRLPLGYFGASTGAAAALVAAAAAPDLVRAVVSRGGRPDLAGASLERVQAPTLLIAGGRDAEVLALNRAAENRLGALGRLAVVPGATHLFEEPGALDEVSRLAASWFRGHMDAAWAPSPGDRLEVSVRGE